MLLDTVEDVSASLGIVGAVKEAVKVCLNSVWHTEPAHSRLSVNVVTPHPCHPLLNWKNILKKTEQEVSQVTKLAPQLNQTFKSQPIIDGSLNYFQHRPRVGKQI